jgi:hypothetical protein
MSKLVFKNKTWQVTWASANEIRVEKITLPIAAHGVSDYAIRYSNGKIAYNHPSWVPDYIKEKVKSAFERSKR